MRHRIARMPYGHRLAWFAAVALLLCSTYTLHVDNNRGGAAALTDAADVLLLAVIVTAVRAAFRDRMRAW